MEFGKRIEQLDFIIDNILCTSSLNEKREIINAMPAELKDDFNCIVEVLNGKYVFGYRMANHTPYSAGTHYRPDFKTFREAINYLKKPSNMHDLSYENIKYHVSGVEPWYEFFQPIVDRELKLGIGNSLLEKSDIAPMLAKKYEGYDKLKYDYVGYFVTEKLDGNRCIAFHDGEKWNFVSRNGKPMHVNFDMSCFPTQLVYDGEILSRQQVEMSEQIARLDFSKTYGSAFNSTSGMINRHSGEKDLVYNIFDIQDNNFVYYFRRRILDEIVNTSSNVRILPVLKIFDHKEMFKNELDDLLGNVVNVGGEGLMINLASAKYSHKRTMDLLKYKDAKTIDMLVLSTYGGTGKYEGMVGGLSCQAVTPNGDIINCNVGTGLSDAQRQAWTDKSLIVGKIVEIEYFSMSQDEFSLGSNYYSLRFPRFKKIRSDKNVTSTF